MEVNCGLPQASTSHSSIRAFASREFLALLHALFFVSGACGLGYQMVWLRQFGFGLGHEMPAVLAVAGALFGGMALGSWALDARISRSPAPGRWYAGLELLIGAWGLASIVLIPEVNNHLQAWIGLDATPFRQWSIGLAGVFVCLLPATAAMGGTFPAMERYASPLVSDGRCVATLYASNTLGAVAGVVVSVFFLIPALGFRGTVCVCGALSLLCGAVVWFLPARCAACESAVPAGEESNTDIGRPAEWLFLTGFLAIGYEVAGVRALNQVLENTVYSYAAALAVYLLGNALGAALCPRVVRRFGYRAVFPWLLCALGVACVGGVCVLGRAGAMYRVCQGALGGSLPGMLAVEWLVAAAVFLLPTLCMGAVFSLLVQTSRRARGRGVGTAVAANTLGGALAPVCFGVVLLPWLGTKWALLSVAAGYWVLALAARSIRAGPDSGRAFGQAWFFAGWLGSLALLWTIPAGRLGMELLPGEGLVSCREGVSDTVAVIGTPDGHRSLRVNNRFGMGGTAAAVAERRQANIPLLLHPNPARALFLGTGTGITFGAALGYPGLTADGVELVPEVAASMEYFESHNARATWPPRLSLTVADARRFVRITPSRYDVIVADLFHPARDGAGGLYTREHFQAIRGCLAPGGLFCQWLPLYQLDEPGLKSVIRTFLDVFPRTHAFLLRFNLETPVLGLVGTPDLIQYTADWVERRGGNSALREHLKAVALTDVWQLLGCHMAGPEALRSYSAGSALNTDDRPVIVFQAPQFLYLRNVTSYGRLFAVLDAVGTDPRGLFSTSPEGAGEARRVSDFIHARNRYLQGLLVETEGHSADAVTAFLESAGLSADFTTAYAHVVTLAVQASRTNPQLTRDLLNGLIKARPEQPVARELLRRLSAE